MAFDLLTQSDPSVALIDSSPSSSTFTASESTTARVPSTSLPMNPSTDDPTTIQPSPSSVEPIEATHKLDPELNASAAHLNLDVDPQILEALKSKDRIYVLKLGEVFEALIKDRRTRIEVTPTTSYQRLLVHRCSAYYKLQPETDPHTKGLYVILTMESRLPERRICELVPAESHSHPAFKIMKRSVPDGRLKPQSHSGSVAGEDADLSDVEPSESGSLGGQSNIAGSTRKKIMTMEEREAAYNEARSRIFLDFEEKEKGKEINPNSSALSISGSTSSTGRSNMGDTDDAASSPATESEWSSTSNTFLRESKREGRRGPSTSASSRTLRGGLYGNGSGSSSRNSRAASPSFNYATIYDPPSSGQAYDASQHCPQMGYSNQFTYAQNQGPNHLFRPTNYTYYGPLNPYQPPTMPQSPPDSSSSSCPESFHHHQMNYIPQYGWPWPYNQPAMQLPHNMHAPAIPHQQPQHNVVHQMSSLPNMVSAPPYMHPSHAYTHPMTSPFPSPPGQQAHQGPLAPGHTVLQQPTYPLYDLRAANGNLNMRLDGFFNGQQYLSNNSGFSGPHAGLGNGTIQPSNTGRSMPNRAGNPDNNNGNGAKRNIPAPPVPRPTWSYGPGVGVSGFPHTGGCGLGSGESIGPRFNNSNRRTSGHVSSGGNSHVSSNYCDDVSSIASSSTTSSSSRRTYTSTTSSQQQQQHPLPPRPDWAVGLKAQSTLTSRHHDHVSNNSRNISSISPSKSNGQNSSGNNTISPLHFQSSSSSSQQQSPAALQPMDFPPLTTNVTTQERRMPVATGAWGSPRPILPLGPNGNFTGPQSPKGEDAGHNHHTSGRSGECSPKHVRRQPATVATNVHSQSRSRSPPRNEAKSDSPLLLTGQIFSMTLGDQSGIAAGITPSS